MAHQPTRVQPDSGYAYRHLHCTEHWGRFPVQGWNDLELDLWYIVTPPSRHDQLAQEPITPSP